MPYSRRDAQDTEITLKFAADATSEHPYASAAHACTYVSGCVSKARTAFPVAPLARVGGGCIELDGPAIISGGCLSVSATRDTTGVSRARDVRKRDVGRILRRGSIVNGLEIEAQTSRAHSVVCGECAREV